MSKPENIYESDPQKWTIEDLKKCCHLKRGNKNYCCINPPLLNIPLEDELHLLLSFTDVFTRNVLDEMIEWDDKFPSLQLLVSIYRKKSKQLTNVASHSMSGKKRMLMGRDLERMTGQASWEMRRKIY